MLKRELIYEREYPHKTAEKLLEETEEWLREHLEEGENKKGASISFAEFYQMIMKGRTLVPLPERIQQAEGFIKLAIEVGKLYEISTKIEKMDSHISVRYSFDCCEGMDYLMPVIRQANAITFFTGVKGYDITIVLDYYTHAVYRKDKLMSPLT